MISPRAEHSFFFALLIGVLVLSFFILRPFLTALVLAITLAILFRPLYEYLKGAFKGKEIVASLGTVFVICLLVLLPLFFFGYQVFQEARVFYVKTVASDSSTGTVDLFAGYAEQYLGPVLPSDFEQRVVAFKTDLRGYLGAGAIWVIENMGVIFSGLARFLLGLFITIVALYYLFIDGARLVRRVVTISPLSDRFDTQIFEKLHGAVTSVIRGVIVIAAVQALLTGIGFAIFGVPSPALWAMVAMIGALIPGIGTALVIIPGILYLFLVGDIGPAVGLLIWGVVAVGLVDNFLTPKLIGRGVKIHSFLILLSVIGGIIFFGPIGFILGPLVFALLFALLEIYQEYVKEKVV